MLFVDYPFKLGVASGVPTATSVVLWTRLAPDPLHGGGMGVSQVRLHWEVATDEHFGNVVQSGDWYAMAGLAHSAHVPVTGLLPDRWYWYRFIAGNEVSPVGRTRTLPRPDADAKRLRFALASCQHYELGYFSAYKAMRADDPDMVLFVGDYIYEYNAAADRVRAHAHPEPYSLAEYRDRYAQYHLDPDLAAMHAAAPWIMTIDDHEVMNDWAGDVGEGLDPRFAERRANALQAYFEHVPLPMDALRKSGALALNQTFDFGRNARFFVLDDRQHRNAEVCSRPGMGGSNIVTDRTCPERRNSMRTMLGGAQEAWLDGAFASTRSRWNIVVQETLMSPFGTPTPDGMQFWTDAWDGYPAARERLLQGIARHRVPNPLIVGGDYHCTIASNVPYQDAAGHQRTLAGEIVGTSITSAGIPQTVLDERVRANPHILHADGTRRGYVLFDVNDKSIDISVRNSESIATTSAPCITRTRFSMHDGISGIKQA